MIMVAVLIMFAALLGLMMIAAQRTIDKSSVVTREYHDERVFQVTDGGANVAERWLRDQLIINPRITQAGLNAAPPPSVPGFHFVEYSITKEARQDDVLVTQGPYAGLLAVRQPFTIRVHGENARSTSESIVEVKTELYWLGLFQFAIYYDGDLELFPRNPSPYTGHIHANGNLYLGSDAVFDITGQVTAAGHIFNIPKDPTQIYHGKARIADRAGHWHDLSYDSRDPHWVERSLGDWAGLVQDSAHGVHELPFPIETLPIAIDLIKRGQFGDDSLHRALRYYYRAGLRIIDGNGFDSLGHVVAIPAGVISNSSVKDWREGHNMEMRDINMDSLRLKGPVPANGTIYVSYSHTYAAVRITHGERLPAGGIIIATDNPLYVLGNYNSIDKQPSSIMCDAFNAYSSGWSDGNATKALNQRSASPTTVNTCIVTGDKLTSPGHYSGGAQNLIRLHEKWTAMAQLTQKGTMVCLWGSEQAVGAFVDGAPVFSENHRVCSFDPQLLNPDFWPDDYFTVMVFARSRWVAF
jgi:hypothetical protein